MNKKKISQFVRRKKDHIHLALQEENSASGSSGFQGIQLLHSALPEIDLSEVDISTRIFGKTLATPFVVTGMTGGWKGSTKVNQIIASACEKRGWVMGIGSQRRQIFDTQASREMRAIRNKNPHLILLGNIGLSQLIRTDLAVVENLVDSLQASAMVVHTNPLQEAIQPEGTPEFRGGLDALHHLCQKCSVPVILKETGCGFSEHTLRQLSGIGLFAVDISGYGGTHWGRVEGQRIQKDHALFGVAEAFKDWGISTVDSLLSATNIKNRDYQLWASGGVRNGCDAAKTLAIGASRVGIASLVMKAALKGEAELERILSRMEYELKVALFCTGCQNIETLYQSVRYKTQK